MKAVTSNHRPGYVKIAALLGLVLVVCLSVAGSEHQATASFPSDVSGHNPHADKIERRVLEDTSNGRSTGFIVLMSEQADLSKAYSMRDQDARGWFVYNTLKATAERSQKGIRSMLDARGITYEVYWAANMLVVTGNRSVVESLAARSDVKVIESNRPFKGIDDPVDIKNTVVTEDNPNTIEWGVQNVNAPQVWAMGYTGQGIVIANQDTGMRWTHNALKPQYRGWDGTNANHNYNWWDGVRTPVPGHTTNPCGYAISAPCDDHGHGTHTTGTTSGDDGAGNQVGVAPGATWIGCRNMDSGDGRPGTYTSCFQFFIAPTDLTGQNPNPALRPHVMNNSWGCPPSEECATTTLRSITEAAQAAGILVVSSAGNSGPNCGSVNVPIAIYNATFAIGAIDIGNNIASFSSRGPVTIDLSNRIKPNISAPGVNVRSAVNTSDTAYANFQGTSMASPHVVGVVALLWSAHPELSRMITETKNLLQNTANPTVVVNPVQTCGGIPSSQIPNNTFGYGRVDVLAAVNGAGSTATPTATNMPTHTRTPGSTPTTTGTPVQLQGHVLLQGRSTPPSPLWSVPLTLTLRLLPSGPTTEYTGITTDDSGHFIVIAPAIGNYTWRVKNPQMLANTGNAALSGGINSVEMNILIAGDANNDNCVTVLDLNVLRNTYGISTNDPDYDARADFNGDARVSLADFSLLKGSFGICGAGPVRPVGEGR